MVTVTFFDLVCIVVLCLGLYFGVRLIDVIFAEVNHKLKINREYNKDVVND